SGRGKAPCRATGFLTPPTKPDMQLSPHPAFHLSVILCLLLMARNAQRPEISERVCIHWPFDVPQRSYMIHVGCGTGHWFLAQAANVAVAFENQRAQVHHAWTRFMTKPGVVVEQFLPLDNSLGRVRVRLARAELVPSGFETGMADQRACFVAEFASVSIMLHDRRHRQLKFPTQPVSQSPEGPCLQGAKLQGGFTGELVVPTPAGDD